VLLPASQEGSLVRQSSDGVELEPTPIKTRNIDKKYMIHRICSVRITTDFQGVKSEPRFVTLLTKLSASAVRLIQNETPNKAQPQQRGALETNKSSNEMMAPKNFAKK
jgi:hypothetical protein